MDTLDYIGQACPLPIFNLAQYIKHLKVGEKLEVLCDDGNFEIDVMTWAKATGNKLVSIKCDKNIYTAVIQKK